MKKFSLLMAAALIAVSSVFVACNKEDGDAPTIEVKAVYATGASTTATKDLTDGETFALDEGTVVTIKVAYKMGSEKLVAVSAYGEANHIKGPYLDTILNAGIFNRADESFDFEFTVKVGAVPTTLTFSATDKGALTTKFEVTLSKNSTVVPAPEISSHSNVKIFCTGADGSGQSAAASADGTTFALTGASTSNQQKCDFVYFYGKMYSPATISTATGTLTNIVNAWTTKRATKFVVRSSGDFDGVDKDNIVAKAGLPAAGSVAISNGAVIGFETADGKTGIFKVTAYQAGYNPTDFVTIDIKVQE